MEVARGDDGAPTHPPTHPPTHFPDKTTHSRPPDRTHALTRPLSAMSPRSVPFMLPRHVCLPLTEQLTCTNLSAASTGTATELAWPAEPRWRFCTANHTHVGLT